MDWSAVDILAEYFQVPDIDVLIGALIQLKTHCDRITAAKND